MSNRQPDALPVHRRPRRRPGENRERLIEAGLHVFARQGYRGASTADIAALAEVPQPHVYASFRAKQDLFLACAERAVERLASGVDDRLPSSFLLQMFAAMGEQGISSELKRLVVELRTARGDEGIEQLLTRGARGLAGY